MKRKSNTPKAALEIIDEERDYLTGKLYFEDCGLNEIPPEIFELDWLKELTITNLPDPTSLLLTSEKIADPNHISEIPPEIAKLEKLEKLHIGPSGSGRWSITEIDHIFELENLKELNLSGNRIHTIINFAKFKRIASVDLSRNEISGIKGDGDILGLNDHMKTLDLSNNFLTKSSFLYDLQNLQHLKLANNKLNILEGIDQNDKIKVLDLGHNMIGSLSSLGKKTELRVLSLEANPIQDIEPMWAYSKLEELNLSNVQILDINVLSNLIKLKKLDLSFTPIPDILPLERLTRLMDLDISYCGIQLIDTLKSLTILRNLNCESNHIVNINPLRNLIHLRSLNLGANYIEFIEPLINLSKLESLILDGNIDIVDAPPEIWQSNDIEQIQGHFAGTSRDIDRNIKQEKALAEVQKKHISLKKKSDQIKQEVEKIQFQEESAKSKGIKAVDPIIEEVIKEAEVDEKGGDVDPIIEEMIKEAQVDEERTLEALHDEKVEAEMIKSIDESLYFKDLKQAEEEQKSVQKEIEATERKLQKILGEKKKLEALVSSDVKLIFVGNSGVGKTQLSEYFENNKLNDERESTHGIRLNRWLPEKNVSEAFESIEEKVAVNIWDFGGQEYYHGTFRLFLSNYAIYILLWDGKTNLNQVIPTEVSKDTVEEIQHFHYKYWLDSIRHYAPTSPIIIIQNKVDRDEKELVDTQLLSDYKISGDHYISLHEATKNDIKHYKWSFDLFCANLAESMELIPEANSHWVKSIAWIQIRDAILEIRSESSKNAKNQFSKYINKSGVITIADFNKVCLMIESELEEVEIKAIPKWLHNSGAIIYFHENDKLNENIYLNPTWVTEGIYSTLNDTVRKNNGEFSTDQMPRAKRGTISKRTVVELMKEMEIIFEKQEVKDGKKHVSYVAPQYLPETHPVEDLYAIAAKGLQQCAYFVRMPLFFFRKVLQRLIFYYGMSKNVDAKYYWKRGILFEKNGTKVMFKGIMPDKDDKHGVFLIGAEPEGDYKSLQKEIFNIIIEILEGNDLTKLSNSKNIKTKKSSSKDVDVGSNLSFDFHERPIDWTIKYKEEDVPRWLQSIEVSTDNENFINYLDLCIANRKKELYINNDDNQKIKIHDFELLLDNKPERPLKVFISYSHNDTQFMYDLNTHLSSLKRLEIVEIWSDMAIKAGEEWNELIHNNLRDSDVILFLISPDFIASNYIWEKEIPLSIQYLKDDNERVSKIIPIYIRPFDFNGLIFGDVEIVPKKGENLLAVSEWDNIDKAYEKVVERIREAITGQK